ncbi:unnamed protein product [Pieris macdunnoughi]|uniref:Uncharacterized protein n=1 Tax=Pieris macdunnoughi TaxID=345717 RepID=A0A821Q7D8_9NEOP|nr:unnamed protein product [Pieris macdunnoughi]
MRHTLVSIMAFLAVLLTAKATDLGRDGFNYYKDYLRGRSDDIAPAPYDDRTFLYYFGIPQSYPEIAIQDYGKRTANLFKNHMLNREAWPGGTPNKRTSKTGLSLLMQSKQDVKPTDDSHYCLYGK